MAAQPNLFGVSAEYCIDTNVFADFWSDPMAQRPYCIEVFERPWQYIDQEIQAGRIVSSMDVFVELKDTKHPDLARWLGANKYIFQPNSPEQIKVLTSIINKYPAYTWEKKNQADPQIVALAKVMGCAVITLEKKITPNGGAVKMPKIPNLCEEFGVPCVSLVDFFIQEGQKF